MGCPTRGVLPPAQPTPTPLTVSRPYALLLLPALLAAAAPAGAQVARLELAGAADTLRVGQPFRVLLTVRPPDGTHPVIPAPAGGDSTTLLLGDAHVVALDRRPPAFVAGARVDSALYTVAVFALDSARVGPVDVPLVAGADTARVTAAALVVRLAPVTAEADSLRPHGPPLPMPRAWGPPALLGVAGAVAVALAARALRRRRARPRRPSPHAHLPPYDEAMARIDALDRAPVATPADAERHHEELADTLRTYVERSRGIEAHRLTSTELVRRLDALEVSEEAREAAAVVLRETDLVKFAARRPDTEALAGARSRARQAIAGLRPVAEEVPA